MTEKPLCPKCGAELSADAAQGLCPKCLLDAGLASQPASAAGVAPTGPFVTPTQAASPTIPPWSPTPYLEMLGRQFPQLEILEHLGQGGMGVVYKARQRQLDRLVALKILPTTLGQEAAFTERFTREARALAKLNHPNIVHVYDFGRTDEHFYFIMEFVDGMNLRSLLHGGTLKPEEALKIVPQICEALQFAHDEGIVHRDIKPENILIDTRGRVKIADFGLAKLMDQHGTDFRLTGTDQVMGTLNYMAPEQMQGSRTVDHRADIYSLGVVFYEMLTGDLPVGRFEVPSKKVRVDVRLDDVVLRSLESEPDRRYQHASEVRTDVERVSGVHKIPSTTAARFGTPALERLAKFKTTEAFAWTCAITAICFCGMGLFLPVVVLRSRTPITSTLLTFLVGQSGAVLFGILGRRVMKLAIPIALIVMGGLVILVPVVSRTYENTAIRQMLVDLSKSAAQGGLTHSDAFQLSREGPSDFTYFVFGGWMIAGGVIWPALANVFGRLFGPRRPKAAKADDELQQAPGEARLTS
jgi:tRNA A-37 threonylcarbamoyl transferase component Bud32